MNEVHITSELICFMDPDYNVIATAPFKYLTNVKVMPYILAMMGAWVKPTGCSAVWLVDQMNLVHARYNLTQIIR